MQIVINICLETRDKQHGVGNVAFLALWLLAGKIHLFLYHRVALHHTGFIKAIQKLEG